MNFWFEMAINAVEVTLILSFLVPVSYTHLRFERCFLCLQNRMNFREEQHETDPFG